MPEQTPQEYLTQAAALAITGVAVWLENLADILERKTNGHQSES